MLDLKNPQNSPEIITIEDSDQEQEDDEQASQPEQELQEFRPTLSMNVRTSQRVTARKLVTQAKRAKSSKTSQSRAHSPKGRPIFEEPNVCLTKEAVDEIYRNSRSIKLFATNLLMRLFSKSELKACSSLYARGRRGGLNENKVNVIRQLVVEKAGSGREVWKNCVKALQTKISYCKQSIEREIR